MATAPLDDPSRMLAPAGDVRKHAVLQYPVRRLHRQELVRPPRSWVLRASLQTPLPDEPLSLHAACSSRNMTLSCSAGKQSLAGSETNV